MTTRALQSVKELLSSRRVHVLSTPIIERAAYREVFGYGQTLYSIVPDKRQALGVTRQPAIGRCPSRSIRASAAEIYAGKHFY